MSRVKCELCGQEFSQRMFLVHLSRVHRNEFSDRESLEFYSVKVKYELSDEIIKIIIDEYKNDGTVLELKQKYGLPYKAIQYIIRGCGENIKSSKEINSQKSVRNKIKNKVIENHGVTNVSKSKKVKEKKKKTFIKNYGVDNIFKVDEFKKNIDDIMIKKYGVRRISGWFTMSDEQKSNQIKRLCSGGSSKLEKRVGSILLNIGLDIESHFKIKNKFYDFKIKDTNYLVEVNGDFWHANPKKYKASDILNFPKNPVIAEFLWKKDEKKDKIALKNGYKVLTLWELDINKLSDIELELYVAEKINKL